jgi:hypothetical protein
MIWFILFLTGAVFALIAVVALLVFLGATVVQGVLTCVEHVLENLNTGHIIVGLLYLIPTGPLICAVGQGVYLVCSFYAAVFK